MGMVVQHNMVAANTNRMLGISVGAMTKSTEKLSSGYKINRAADDAAGLAISEKMRSQIRGLDKASVNASDGISMIQTAEGALSETHSILQRMRELAVQASNGTETDDDRGNIQDEIEQLQDELDRIASDTEFNTMTLLDGSLSTSVSTTSAGPKFGAYDWGLQAFITSDVQGVEVNAISSAQQGGESAVWDNNGRLLTLNLAANTTYSQAEIDELVKNAKQEDSTATNTPANIKISLKNNSITAQPATTGNILATKTGVGTRARTDTLNFYSNATGQTVKIDTSDNTNAGVNVGAETAAYDATNKILTIKLNADKLNNNGSFRYGNGYSESELTEIINKASADLKAADVSFDVDISTPTEAGVKASSAEVRLFDPEKDAGQFIGANQIQFTSNKYGVDTNIGLTMDTLASEGNEEVTLVTQATYDNTGNLKTPAQYRLSLCSGKEYTEAEIEEVFAKAGLDMDVKLSSANPDEPNTLFVVEAKKLDGYLKATEDANDGTHGINAGDTVYVKNGAAFNLGTTPITGVDEYGNAVTIVDSIRGIFGRGLGDEDAFLGEKKYGTSGGGSGVILQVGANYGQTMSFSIGNMSSTALGVSVTTVNTSTQQGAMKAIDAIDGGIAIVSKQRALLGAVQNRLEHTISSLDNTSENLQSAESGIRDTDMASEMVTYSKYNILQQAGQSMLAQANQANQGVLSIIQ